MSIGWLDCSAGVSGDMLLGALHDLGALDDLPAALDRAGIPARVEATRVTRAGLAATAVAVVVADAQPHRRLADLLALTAATDLPEPVLATAGAVLHRLAGAEAAVHGVAVDAVELHEVGAVDTVVDVLGCCLGLHVLGLQRLYVGPIALGGGQVHSAHGALPVPPPAVVQLLAGSSLAARGGPVERELATPTGVALLAELAEPVDAMPALQVERVGTGAGGADLPTHPNVVRLVIGTPVAPSQTPVAPSQTPVAPSETPGAEPDEWLLVETNVDDLDPRLWPSILDSILAAGAADAWLTPILMKKGRPAHTLAALTDRARLDAVTATIFRTSSTIGVRTTAVGKRALERDWVHVEIDGHAVRVKQARLDGQVVNASPEWEDVVAVAKATGRAPKDVLAAAIAAVRPPA
jgi:uncharacterized protein (TIGR00299 family) protein